VREPKNPARGAVGMRGEALGFFALFWLLFWASKKVTGAAKRIKFRNGKKVNPKLTLILS